jgi:hypothetical protein
VGFPGSIPRTSYNCGVYEVLTLVGILAIFFAGLYAAALYGRRTRKFYWSEYVVVTTLPSFALLWTWYRIGPEAVYMYAITCFAGPILEYTLGRAYHFTIGKRLWTYKTSRLGGYTSLLVIPYWGLVGICVLAVAQFFV